MSEPLCPSLGGNGRRTVAIDDDRLRRTASEIVAARRRDDEEIWAQWDEHGWHYTGSSYQRSSSRMSEAERQRHRRERVALYVLTLDAMNFCFWPAHDENDDDDIEKLEYDHLAVALKRLAETDDVLKDVDVAAGLKDPASTTTIVAEDTYLLSPRSLSEMTPDRLRSLLSSTGVRPISRLPNVDERCRLLNELGHGLILSHDSSASRLLDAARGSADCLVFLLLRDFAGFRDACVDDAGATMFLHKRAQIAVADLAAAGALGDAVGADDLTTFADYRVPQLLRHAGVLRYAPELAAVVDGRAEIPAGHAHEIHVRAATVVAVERLVKEVNALEKKEKSLRERVNAVRLDWYLWQTGERLEKDEIMAPHHRVRTIYY